MSERKKVEESSSFSCPSCGGKMVFTPETQTMKCPYCGTEKKVDFAYTTPEEYDVFGARQNTDWGDTMRVIKCPSCGAETVLDQHTTATFCAFCGSPHVLEEQGSAGIAPESMIPFSIGKEQAVTAFRAWIKKRHFAPNGLKKIAALGELAGVYLPTYTYDSDATADYVGQEGHWYYVTVPVQVRDSNGRSHTEMRRERRTDWRPTAGQVGKYFDDVPVPGSRRLNQRLLSTVYPYDTSKLISYQKEYLSGFASEKPAVSVQEGWSTAREQIENELKDMARRDILSRADEARVTAVSANHRDVRYKLVLWPAWLSAFNFKDKKFNVLINGQTGKVGGESPKSAWKIALFVLFLLAVIGVIVYLLMEGDGAQYISYYY